MERGELKRPEFTIDVTYYAPIPSPEPFSQVIFTHDHLTSLSPITRTGRKSRPLNRREPSNKGTLRELYQ